jgi:hypothetical protein
MPEPLTEEAERSRLTDRLRKALVQRESPRAEMAAFVAASGAAGFLASVLLLHAGLWRISVRYVAAVTIAYAVFLALLYLWILRRRSAGHGARQSGGSSSSADIDPMVALDLGGSSSGGSGSSGGGLFSAGGGRFGGAGSTGSWAGAAGKSGSASGASHSGSGIDLSFDDDTAVVIAVVVAAGVLLGASVWIVLAAPSLFADLMVDGVLSAGLYRRLRQIPHRPWLETALRHTVLPFLLVAVTVGVCGHVMQRYAPEAHSLRAVFAHRQATRQGP